MGPSFSSEFYFIGEKLKNIFIGEFFKKRTKSREQFDDKLTNDEKMWK